VTTGVGNGSTFRMIPVIFRRENLRAVEGAGPEAETRALAAARRESAAVLGFASAIGACGGYLIPRSFGASIHATGGVGAALTGFLCFYLTCIGLTWWFYVRRTVPSVATASDASLLAEVRV
jgi:NNP family nitrate/nitrite transporter-like MFS transporter